ncbi:glycosyltransferase [Deinococcus sp. RL]|uniref:glycosyltransferase n=1 Tax=Deinococcus sp. RL TaxID=1489678 RepID=UPI001378D63C|nr:glycosyltransferase [Deinococcus sp. RL]
MKTYDVLVILDHYLPGRLAGGPVTTIANLAQRLGDRLRLLVVTRNYDLDGSPYPQNVPGKIYSLQGADVIYLTREQFGPLAFRALLREYSIPTLYLNSFFSPSTIKTLLWNQLAPLGVRIVLAPRGEFSPGALALKPGKKQTYLAIFKGLRLWKGVATFQASTIVEQRDIWRILGPVPVHVAVDLTPAVKKVPRQVHQSRGRVVFVSRISPKKNLAYALEVIKQVRVPLDFHIYGPLEDQDYWERCRQTMSDLPDGVRVEYRGVAEHQRVREIFSSYDVFLFPTLGENYGHVIWEALAAGCPVVVSDQTSWQDFKAAGVGDVLPLSAPEAFAGTVAALVQESAPTKLERAARCVAYAERVAGDTHALEENLALFQPAKALNSGQEA